MPTAGLSPVPQSTALRVQPPLDPGAPLRRAEATECDVGSTRRNPAGPRALRHLETMLAPQPEATTAVTDLPATLAACRALAGPGRRVQ